MTSSSVKRNNPADDHDAVRRAVDGANGSRAENLRVPLLLPSFYSPAFCPFLSTSSPCTIRAHVSSPSLRLPALASPLSVKSARPTPTGQFSSCLPFAAQALPLEKEKASSEANLCPPLASLITCTAGLSDPADATIGLQETRTGGCPLGPSGPTHAVSVSS